MARDDDVKDSWELEQEVGQERSAIEQTLNELLERFSPQQLLRHFLNPDGLKQGQGGQRPRQLLDVFSANPVPTLVAAAGLGWLMMSQTKTGEASSGLAPASDEPSHASYGVDPDYDPGSGAGHVALEKGEFDTGAGEKHYESIHYEDNLGSEVSSLLHRQPLLVAAFGLALGGLLGAALPRLSRRETGFSDRLQEFGEHSADLARSGRESGDLVEEGEPPADVPIRH